MPPLMLPGKRDQVILDYNLWGFDETPYRVLRNKLVVVRQAHTCAICRGSIAVGDRVRAQSEVLDDKAMTFRICALCCDAIVADALEGDCLHMERRTQLGMLRTSTAL